MKALRSYQQEQYQKVRESISRNRAICVQGATGSGKTPLTAAMCDSVYGKNKRAWVVANRNELLGQISNHLKKWGVPHGMIHRDMHESKAFKIHVVSKDTLIRRYKKIINWPDLLIFDECHLYLDRQIEIVSVMDEWLIKNNIDPFNNKIIGMTATCERYDGRGLWSGSGGLYDDLILGKSIPWLTERGFLTPLRYFAPYLEDLDKIPIRGYDYDEVSLEELFKRKKIYGQIVDHYANYGKNKAALIFCRSVKSAYQTAERFREKGFKFYCIEGKLTNKKRQGLIGALTKGEIDGLTNCEIATYGLDIPRIEYGASIRPTLSRALYFQMIGRILRPFEGKEDALFFDHVNLILEHQEPNYPGIPPHFVPEIHWNFKGTKKSKRNKEKANIKLCPYMDFMYCDKPHCASCQHNKDKSIKDARRPMVVIPAELKEMKPIPLNERPFQEKREFQDRIGRAILDYKTNQSSKAVTELIKIAEMLGWRNKEFRIYHILSGDNHAINVPLLSEIARQLNFKPGWVWYARKNLTIRKIKGG